MATLTAADVRRIARLARLELGDDEVARIADDLGRIVAYVGQLEEVDVTDVPPATHAVARLPLRADQPGPSLDPELVLREAPRAEDGAFAVPTFVED